MPKVSIVIPNWNGVEKLTRNLPKVLKVKGVDEVIVVDDGSTDQSVSLVQKEFPQVKLVVQKTNHGFSTTVNNGVKNVQGDFVFLLNTDAVPKEDCVEKALRNFDDPKVFSVSCNSGGSWSWGKFEKGYFWHYMAEKTDKPHQTLWSSGGSGIFRKSLWEEMGGLDESFNKFYEEDVDLGYRATKRGYINIWDPLANVEHYKEVGVIAQNYSPELISKVAQRNQLLFIWKNIYDKKMIHAHLRELLKKILAHPGYWPVFLSANLRLPKILKERALEKKAGKLSDQEILGKF